ncbi:hypothetical protein KIPB_009403 [Kipferlia bialata]|uniref:Abnormal spindle-like microcephaly-associated protein ASH domain-containing protein n=1 Tax=Kipferlia bialata TaxID=797122 RepID=A0A9K3GLI0_9EUKA|nr:hypothetical protein KIPB_009403 [Kipferlia bialata]|eukprot:g9403.t1
MYSVESPFVVTPASCPPIAPGESLELRVSLLTTGAHVSDLRRKSVTGAFCLSALPALSTCDGKKEMQLQMLATISETEGGETGEIPTVLPLSLCTVPLAASIEYPDVSFGPGWDKLSFGTILNGSVASRSLTLTNTSPWPVSLECVIAPDRDEAETEEGVQGDDGDVRDVPFDVTPARRVLDVGASHTVSCCYFAGTDSSSHATLAVRVQNGACYLYRLSGRSSGVSCLVEPSSLDFGTVPFNSVHHGTITLRNPSPVPFDLSVVPDNDAMTRFCTVSPSKVTVSAKSTQTLQVELRPLVPWPVECVFHLRGPKLPSQTVRVTADGYVEKVGVSLGRFTPEDMEEEEDVSSSTLALWPTVAQGVASAEGELLTKKSEKEKEREGERLRDVVCLTQSILKELSVSRPKSRPRSRAASRLLGGPALAAPPILSRYVIDFGPVLKGSQATTSFVVKNLSAVGGSVSLEFDRQEITQRGMSFDPYQIKKLPPGDKITVTATLQGKSTEAMPLGPVEFSLPMQLRSGAAVMFTVKAVVARPALLVTNPTETQGEHAGVPQGSLGLNFGSILAGQVRSVPVKVFNPTPLQVSYSTEMPQSVGSFTPPPFFTLHPSKGVIAPHSSVSVDCMFTSCPGSMKHKQLLQSGMAEDGKVTQRLYLVTPGGQKKVPLSCVGHCIMPKLSVLPYAPPVPSLPPLTEIPEGAEEGEAEPAEKPPQPETEDVVDPASDVPVQVIEMPPSLPGSEVGSVRIMRLSNDSPSELRVRIANFNRVSFLQKAVTQALVEKGVCPPVHGQPLLPPPVLDGSLDKSISTAAAHFEGSVIGEYARELQELQVGYVWVVLM